MKVNLTSAMLRLVFSSLLLASLLLLSPLAFAMQPRSPFEPPCRDKLDLVEWRYVLLYQQELTMSLRGRQLLESLREVDKNYFPPSDERPVPPKLQQRIEALLQESAVEKARKDLHRLSRHVAFDCVDGFERWAAGEIDRHHWALPAQVEHDPTQVELHPVHAKADAEEHPNAKFERWDAIKEDLIHPEDVMH
jgi:hypothetical protein